MNHLIVYANQAEIAPLLTFLNTHWSRTPEGSYFYGSCVVDIVITGVGMHKMSYSIGSAFATSKPDLCVNAGIAGAFPGKAEIGEVVHVISEVIVDLGAEDADGSFIALKDLVLDDNPDHDQNLVNQDAGQYQFLRAVRGITANTAHGYQPSIDALIKRYDPEVESMEGGAFFYCCLKAKVPFIEIRAISNIVTARDRDTWDIPSAVNQLSVELQTICQFFAGT
jgi:futalosine hydrolase